MREIKKIIEELGKHDFWEHALILDLLKRAYNTGIQDAADNAYVEYVDLTSDEIFDYTDVMRDDDVAAQVNKESILKLKL
jgi:hypothetical protein